jgi:hypothetical protein
MGRSQRGLRIKVSSDMELTDWEDGRKGLKEKVGED